MQQRVAIARALVSSPDVLLLDEPFASVDALTRAELQDVLLRVHREREQRRVTIVHVTHDIDEAVYLADRVLVLSSAPGRLVGAVDVGLSRPRSQTTTRSLPRFLEIRNRDPRLIARSQRKDRGSRPHDTGRFAAGQISCRAVLCLTLVVLVPASAGLAVAAGAGGEAPPTVAPSPSSPLEPAAQAFYAKDRGFFAKQGIDAKITVLSDPAPDPRRRACPATRSSRASTSAALATLKIA